MSPVRLCPLVCMMALAAGIARAQMVTTPSFGAMLRTRRLLHSGDQGQGVRVGVISDGTSHYGTLARQGILPSVAFYGGDASHGDEGDSMLQVVHRIAPEARLAFCPGGPTVQTVACARDLVEKFHADIVVDDINPQPVYTFPDGKDVGYAELSRQHPKVLFFTDAGNSADAYYEAPWTPIPLMLHYTRYDAQDFRASAGDTADPGDPYERLRVPPGAGVKLVLGTNVDPNGRPRCSAGNPDVTLALLDSSDDMLDSVHGRCPILTLSVPHPPTDSGALRVVVLLPPDSHPRKLKLKLVALTVGDHGVAPLRLEYRTGGGAGNSATAPNVTAVAAVDPNTGWRRRYLYESSSNSGPQCMDYQRSGARWTALPTPRCLHQPAFVVPDRIPVVMPGRDEERYVPLSGDAAAGPVAAGVTALLLSAHVPAHRIIGLLEQTADPQSDTPGWNAHYGYGLIDADAAAVGAGVLPPIRHIDPPQARIHLFHRTTAFLQEQQLAQQARHGDHDALAQLRSAARAGNADAQASLAQYEHRIGNESLAAHWAMMAADLGQPVAQNLLGSMYEHGWGVPVDLRAAQAWWWRAARAGLPAAMFDLGSTLTGGRGTPSNAELGYALMRSAYMRGMRFTHMVRRIALVRLRMRFGQIGAAERLVSRFSARPETIPPP